jgi:hypothetical protein
MSDIEQIRVRIERRLAELTAEITALGEARSRLLAAEAAAAAQLSTASEPPVLTPKPPRRRAGARRSRTPAGHLSRDAVETMLRQSGGLSVAAIARRGGVTQADARAVLDALAADGRARNSGPNRTWRLLTDEERIAERTAELEAQLVAVAAARAAGGRSTR